MLKQNESSFEIPNEFFGKQVFYGIGYTANELGVSRSTARRWIKEKSLYTVVIDDRVMIPDWELEKKRLAAEYKLFPPKLRYFILQCNQMVFPKEYKVLYINHLMLGSLLDKSLRSILSKSLKFCFGEDFIRISLLKMKTPNEIINSKGNRYMAYYYSKYKKLTIMKLSDVNENIWGNKGNYRFLYCPDWELFKTNFKHNSQKTVEKEFRINH